MYSTAEIMPIQAINTAMTAKENFEREPVKLLKKIGSAMYIINVYSNPTATAKQKMFRLMEREAQNA